MPEIKATTATVAVIVYFPPVSGSVLNALWAWSLFILMTILRARTSRNPSYKLGNGGPQVKRLVQDHKVLSDRAEWDPGLPPEPSIWAPKLIRHPSGPARAALGGLAHWKKKKKIQVPEYRPRFSNEKYIPQWPGIYFSVPAFPIISSQLW